MDIKRPNSEIITISKDDIEHLLDATKAARQWARHFAVFGDQSWIYQVLDFAIKQFESNESWVKRT